MDYYNRIADKLLINSLVSCWNIESDEFLASLKIDTNNAVKFRWDGRVNKLKWYFGGGRGGEGEKESWRGSFSQDKRRYKKSADQY